MAKPRRSLFAMLGWVVWKLLALLGLKFAKDKLDHGRRQRS